jgi:preprotein translocase subunit SecE
VSAFFEEFLRFSIYKRSQGRIVRQVTFAALAITLVIGLWQMSRYLQGQIQDCPLWVGLGIPVGIGLITLWAAYRLVNLPSFADFLIAVEAEMNKVSWPSRSELFRWSVVVIVMIFAIGLLLAVFDAFWFELFMKIGVYSK